MTWQQLTDAILQYKIRFIATFFIIFVITYTILFVVDFLPEAPEPTLEAESVAELSETEREVMSEETDLQELQSVSSEPLNVEIIDADPVESEQPADLPVSMYIEALDRTISVLNPVSRNIDALDTALLDGVVRHPDSATPNQDGNVFILGHSSYLPNVFNRNFQAFNGIQNLKWGDTITLSSNNTTYTYRVEKVYKARASEVTVPIAGTGQMLTIATCNSFGSTDDRYIVEAMLVSTV